MRFLFVEQMLLNENIDKSFAPSSLGFFFFFPEYHPLRRHFRFEEIS